MISPIGVAGFCLLSALSADNDDAARASRPFDATRNGFLLGEGAGFCRARGVGSGARARRAHLRRARGRRQFVVELSDHRLAARRRRTDPGDARRRWPTRAPTTGDIDYINAHGTSTSMNDRSESAAIHAVFGDDAKRVATSSTKSTMGHLIAAAGAVEVVVCALAIDRGEMPVNANLRDRDPDCDLNLVVDAPRRQRIRMTMSNSFGFGGSNSCIVMRHPEEVDGRAGRADAASPRSAS